MHGPFGVTSQLIQLCGQKVGPVQVNALTGLVPALLSSHTAGSADLSLARRSQMATLAMSSFFFGHPLIV